MSTTIKDIAKAAGVSYATVSRALSGAGGVSDATAKRIIQLAQELDYSPNKVAQMLVNRRSHMLGLILPDISNPFFAQLALGVVQKAGELGYQTLICNSGWNEETEREQLRLMKESCADGVLLKPCSDGEGSFSFCKNLGLPVVLLNAIGEQLSGVDVDHRLGGKIMTRHLIDCGYKRIAFAGGLPSSRSSCERFLGYRAALEESGIEFDERLAVTGCGFSRKSGFDAAAALFDLPCQPDAIFCCTDIVALGVLQYAEENGIAVPDSLGVGGFDGSDFASLYQVRLTTVIQDGAKMSIEATNMLIDLISCDNNALSSVILKPELKIRNTTGVLFK